MRVLVCGGRDFFDRKRIYQALRELRPSVIINGGSTGADAISSSFAQAFDVPLEVYPAEWKAFGRRAGPIRNRYMLRESRPDVVLAFPGHRGTRHMVKISVRAGVHVILA